MQATRRVGTPTLAEVGRIAVDHHQATLSKRAAKIELHSRLDNPRAVERAKAAKLAAFNTQRRLERACEAFSAKGVV